MACPYFYPTVEMGPGYSILPLGGPYSGECRAGSGHAPTPDTVTVRDICNLGYARGRCAHFPDREGPDAVRFAVTRHEGGLVGISCVVEKGHLPFWHGVLEYALEDGRFAAAAAGEIVMRQARAYVASYLRRKKEA